MLHPQWNLAFLPRYNNVALCAPFLALSASNPVKVVSEKPSAPSVVRQACQLTLKVNGERKHSLHLGFLAPGTRALITEKGGEADTMSLVISLLGEVITVGTVFSTILFELSVFCLFVSFVANLQQETS